MEARGCIVGICSPIPQHGTLEFLGIELMSSGLAAKAFTHRSFSLGQVCTFLFSFFFSTLTIEPRGLHMLGNCSTT